MTDSDEVKKVEVGWGAWCHDDDLGNIYMKWASIGNGAEK